MAKRRVVLLLHSSIEFDSRVKREAVSLAAAGLDVYVITPSSSPQREEYELHGVKIIEQPVSYALLTARELRGRPSRENRTRQGRGWKKHLPRRDALRYADTQAASYANRIIEMEGERRYFKPARLANHELQKNLRWALRLPLPLRKPFLLGVRIHGRAMQATARNPRAFEMISGRAIRRFGLNRRAGLWNRRLARQRALVRGSSRSEKRERPISWERAEPQIRDLEVAYAGLLDRLAPAVIQANDFHTLPTAVHAKRRAAAQGRSVKVLYDSHEDAAGLEQHYGARRSAAFAEVEATYIGEVDAVMTVSPQLGRRLQDRYGLKTPPAVVLNAPPQGSAHSQVPSLRDLIGIADDIPLGVYAGGVNKNRGLDLLIQAIGRLPELHVALVLTTISERTRDLMTAWVEQEAVTDRVHFVPAVRPHEVAAYLSDGDLGFVVASNEVANHNVSLPNKLFEYLQAGLPIVTSNLDALEDFVESYGIGCVFPYPDVDALVKCIRWVLDNRPSLREAITPEFLRTFSWEGSQNALLAVYQDLLSIDLNPAPIPLDLTVVRPTHEV